VTVYRTGTHHGVTIVAEDDGVIFCGCEGHDCARGHLAGMVGDGQFLTGDPHLAARVRALLRCGPDYRHDSDWALAERICALLNAGEHGGPRSTLGDLVVMHGPYEPYAIVPNQVMRFIESDHLNALRAELVALRDIATSGHGPTAQDHTRGTAEALALVADRIADAADQGPDSRFLALGAIRLILEGVAAELGIDNSGPVVGPFDQSPALGGHTEGHR
jgi:hypothetical protein